MSKYINAEELRKILEEKRDSFYPLPVIRGEYDDGMATGYDGAIDFLDEMPSADVVEVVRCGGCKYCEKSFCSNLRDWCEKYSTPIYTEYVNSTDYCSKGEKRETE